MPTQWSALAAVLGEVGADAAAWDRARLSRGRARAQLRGAPPLPGGVGALCGLTACAWQPPLSLGVRKQTPRQHGKEQSRYRSAIPCPSITSPKHTIASTLGHASACCCLFRAERGHGRAAPPHDFCFGRVPVVSRHHPEPRRTLGFAPRSRHPVAAGLIGQPAYLLSDGGGPMTALSLKAGLGFSPTAAGLATECRCG